MSIKKGFLLIELMVGLIMSILFISIITHYIIEVKMRQQLVLKTMENVSILRNQKEKTLAQNNINNHV